MMWLDAGQTLVGHSQHDGHMSVIPADARNKDYKRLMELGTSIDAHVPAPPRAEVLRNTLADRLTDAEAEAWEHVVGGWTAKQRILFDTRHTVDRTHQRLRTMMTDVVTRAGETQDIAGRVSEILAPERMRMRR